MSLFAKQLIGNNQIEEIKRAIQQAEKNTSGEIRVHIEKHCKQDVLHRAAAIFHSLKMDKTEAQNGVLIYVALSDKTFAIVGDKGIDSKVPPDFWESTKHTMLQYFKQDQIAEGIIAGIHLAGEKLKTFFPYMQGDKNELSDDVSFS